MGMTCAKCGSTEVLDDVPIVAGADNFSAVPVSAMAYRRPQALIFRGPAPHRFLARVCGACGFAELYLEDPAGFLALARRPPTEEA